MSTGGISVLPEEGSGGPARIAVVIVTYNSAGVLGECLDSIAAGAEGVHLVSVIVADNASKDDSVRVAESRTALPVRVVQVGRNAGYSAAINAAVATIGDGECDAVYVINPDCRLRPGSLAPLVAALRRPGRGIAVPLIVNPDGTLQHSLRRMPTVGRAWAEALIGGNAAGRLGRLGELITDARLYEAPGAAVWATGAAMLISAVALAEVGPWDESFLLYSEETEYALRAADHGYALWFEPASVVEHIGGESGVNPTLAALLMVNKVKLFRRRRGPVAGAAYYLAMVLGTAVRAAAGRVTAKASLQALLMPSRRMKDLPQ
ncbi:glycosyltransferase family 2 protein [Planomonospora venezuelensis]|uniref:GT2 family glycosyltransferase n=1 Tax=Planomonospora venezuelensis TaxID=1999 RepID=A0A841CV97_PLAVE|nr:glycosyltransferase family 2 protein [Planomonospora venezuelensis]MBB5961270.1 GT2 family glycosyltransferase [Planomonospora venezuelensis]GIM99944.1 glycosyl transferase family 2 [Planomonospora venezuelensis]